MLIPKFIGELEVLLSAEIDSQCKHTKNCIHTFEGKVLGKAKWAVITKPDSTGSCFLFLCYSNDELTDTSHDSIEGAKEQAEWEYEDISNVWQNAT